MKLTRHTNRHTSFHFKQKLHSNLDNSEHLLCSSVLEEKTLNIFQLQKVTSVRISPRDISGVSQRREKITADKKRFQTSSDMQRMQVRLDIWLTHMYHGSVGK